MIGIASRRRFLRSLAAIPAAAAGTVRAATGPAARVGDAVAWRDVPLLDGGVLKAAQLARAAVVVEFWASWCPFCKRHNPHVQALHERHGGALVVLGYSIDKDPAKAREYMKENAYTFAAAMAGTDAERWFGRREGLPEIYVVDGGRIVFRDLREMFPEDVAALGRYAHRS